MRALIAKRALRSVLLPLALVGALCAVSASGAQALTQHNWFSGSLQPQQSYGGLTAFNNMTGAIATYSGSGQITVCESVYAGALSRFIQGSCGLNGAGNALNVQGYSSYTLWPYVQNGSSSAHTINGIAYTSP